jgi:hypothetical protein
MTATLLNLIPGFAFGAISVLFHLQKQKIQFNNMNWTQLTLKFLLGFAIGIATLPIIFWLKGYVVHLLVSYPDVLLSKGQKMLIAVGIAFGFIGGLKIGQRETS